MTTSEGTSHDNEGYIGAIDGLRAAAVLSVIFYHLNASILPGGFSGVDVFFVISGYVVSGSLLRAKATGFLRFTTAFYSRRIIRIYPALVVCLVLSALFQTLLIPISWLSNTTNETAIYAFFGLSNFALVLLNDGYFSPRVEFNCFTHTWSLAVEEQYYLLFPAVVYAWMKYRKIAGTHGFISRGLLIALLVLSFIYSAFETYRAPEHAYYLLPSRFWELASGALLSRLHFQNIVVAESKRAANACLLGGLVFVGSGLVFSNANHFPFPYALLAVIGTLLILASVARTSALPGWQPFLLGNSVFQYIGRLSYSLYLWHWPILVLFRWTVGLDSFRNSIVALLLIATVSIISYHIVEGPSKRVGRLIRVPELTLIGGFVLIVLSLRVTEKLFWLQPKLTLSVTRDSAVWYPDASTAVTNGGLTYEGAFTDRRLFVLGDSHADAYTRMFARLNAEQGAVVRVFSKGGCSVASLLRLPDAECAQFIAKAVASIKAEARPGDIVFLAALRMNRLSDQWKTFDQSEIRGQQLTDSTIERPQVLKAASNLISDFENDSLTVVIDAPMPVFRSPPFRCADVFNSSNPICRDGFLVNRNELLGYREPVMNALSELTGEHKRLIVWDSFYVLCPGDHCDAFDGAKPLFFDGDHLSGYGNVLLYPSFLRLLRGIWRKE